MTEQVSEQRWVGSSQGKNAWAEVAREVLTEVAGHYGAVITYADLAEDVQVRAGMRTRSPYRSWIGGVLAAVVARCRADRLPPLTSLVVHRAGDDVEVEDATVQARLACYRHFADDVPAEVIAQAEAEVRAKEAAAEEAALARRPKSRPSRATRERQAKPPEEAPKICPTCFIQVPASGICDSCG